MDYKEFKYAFKTDLKRIMNHNGLNVQLSEHHINKMNNSYDAITITPIGGNVGVNANLDALFKMIENGNDYNIVVSKATETLIAGIKDMPQLNVNDLTDYDKMKSNLSMEVVSAERNSDILKKIPYEKMEDMAVVYRLIIDKSNDCNSTVLVTNDLLKQFGITHEQLRDDALAIAPELRPAEIKGMTEMLTEMTGMEVDPSMHAVDDVMYVATVQDKIKGAGVLAYPNFMEDAAEKLGGDYYVLPSSVHEVLLVKDNGSMNVKDLESMVKEVNATQVEPEDQLTDHVYHYDSKEHLFELADKYVERQNDKDAAEHDDSKGSLLKQLDDKKKEVFKASPEKHNDTVRKGRGGEAL